MNTEVKKIIELYNRYGDKNYLEFWYKGRTKQHILWYKLILQYPDASMGAERYGRRKDEYRSIDPSGGPRMTIGIFEIENMWLHKIVFQKGEGFRLGFIQNK